MLCSVITIFIRWRINTKKHKDRKFPTYSSFLIEMINLHVTVLKYVSIAFGVYQFLILFIFNSRIVIGENKEPKMANLKCLNR